MARYTGSRAFDAEIDLDFEKGEIQMDYSLNKFGNPYISDYCVVNSEWPDQPIRTRLKHAMVEMGCIISGLCMGIMMAVMSTAGSYGLIKNENIHYGWQSFLKGWFMEGHGNFEQSREGPILESTITFYVKRNIWFEYELEGDYRDKIRKVSLRRNLLDYRRYGLFREKRQSGWKIIFEFTEPPQSGKCLIRYV